MSPGLTPVTSEAVTAPLLHTAPSCHWDYQMPLDTYLLQQGLEGQGKQLAAQHLFCSQSKASKTSKVPLSPVHPKCLAPRVQEWSGQVLCP